MFTNIVDTILDLPESLAKLGNTLYNFLFSYITIGGESYSMWLILSGVGIVTLIIISIINR